MKNRKRRNRVFILFILLLTISIGFAALSTQLNVVGTTGISKNTWSVYWANVGNESGIVPTTSPTISNEDETHPNTVISFGVTLAEPGDYYEFEVDAVNNGTIDAMLTGVTTNITSNGVSATLPSYILYSVKYSDGEERKEYPDAALRRRRRGCLRLCRTGEGEASGEEQRTEGQHREPDSLGG